MPVPTGTAVPVGSFPAQGDWRARVADFTAQPAFRRALPALVVVGTVALVAALYLSIAQGPQRTLYASLNDSERAKVVEALERGNIS
jgi:flagellar M-ring protein FliF